MPRLTTRAFEGYIINFCKETWRESRLSLGGYEFDDLLQEAAIVFLVCRDRYAGKVDNPRWFMALFSRALYNRFVDLQRTNRSYSPIDDDLDDRVSPWDEPQPDAGYCRRVLAELPAPIRRLLAAFTAGDDSVLPDLKERVEAFLPA